MRNAFHRLLGKSLLAGLAAGVAALLAIPMPAHAVPVCTDAFDCANNEPEFSQLGHVVVPGVPLVSFDISWVDTVINEYFLADRSNNTIDVLLMQSPPPVFQIKPTGINAFAGNVTCPDGSVNICAGPDGVITLLDPGNIVGRELWVGDGPTINPVCPFGMPTCSTVKVFAGNAALLTHVISTGGAFRADELCFAPPKGEARPNGVVVIANDADIPPFLSFIPTTGPFAYQVVKKIGIPVATNGIEQCQYDPDTDKFYVNIPEVNGPGDDSVDGAVFSYNPTTMTQVKAFDIDVADCAGPQGMAIGPRPGHHDILLGCNAKSPGDGFKTILVDNGHFIPEFVYTDAGGADEVWFDAETPVGFGGFHYFIAGGSHLPNEQMVVLDSVSPEEIDQTIVTGFPGSTTRRTHSVASWSGNAPGLGNVTGAILPVPATGGTPAPFSSTLCGSDAAKGCIAFFVGQPVPDTP
jgi:hypothetical protein